MRAAVVQLNSQEDVLYNLGRVGEWIERAAGAGAEFVTLPENFAFMGEEAKKREIAERIDGAFFDEAKNGRVPGVKDLGILDANTD